jgi:hypothetical protein
MDRWTQVGYDSGARRAKRFMTTKEGTPSEKYPEEALVSIDGITGDRQH